MYLLKVSEGEEKDNQAEAAFEERMDDYFPKLIRETHS